MISKTIGFRGLANIFRQTHMGFAFFCPSQTASETAPGHSFRDCESLFPVHHGTFAAELDWEESYCLQLHL